MKTDSLGLLIIADLFGCQRIPDLVTVYDACLEACREAGLHPVRTTAQDFPPEEHGDNHGPSVLALVVPLKESHLAVHAWPAHGVVCIDLFTCAEHAPAREAAKHLAQTFAPRCMYWREETRGGAGGGE